MKPTIATNPTDGTPVILITPDPIPYTLDQVNQEIEGITNQIAMFQKGIDEKTTELAKWQGYKDQFSVDVSIDPQPLPVAEVAV